MRTIEAHLEAPRPGVFEFATVASRRAARRRSAIPAPFEPGHRASVIVTGETLATRHAVTTLSWRALPQPKSHRSTLPRRWHGAC
jgi:hypothetical protein